MRPAMTVLALAAWCGAAAQPQHSPIRSDESVVLFPTFAARGADGWRVRVHGWIFELEEDSAWRDAAIDAFGRALGLSEAERRSARFAERARPFLADNERGKRVGIRLGSSAHETPPSGLNGHFHAEFMVRAADVEPAAGIPPRIETDVVSASPGARIRPDVVFLLEPRGLSVVCDVDDTIKESDVRDRDRLLRRTFVEPFEPVRGMSDLCAALAGGGAAFHYLSASPWQLYVPLAGFLREHGFPGGTVALRPFRLKDETAANLLRAPGAFKRDALGEVLETFPGRRFVCIGDTAEDDAAVYSDAALAEPGRIVFIAIRAVPGDEEGHRRARTLLERLPAEKWLVFQDPDEVPVDTILRMAGEPDADG